MLSRKLVALALMLGVRLYGLAVTGVTVEQLEQALAASGGKRDGELAAQLSGMELTERLSTRRLALLESALPGARSHRAMMTLADASASLELPAADIPKLAEPDAATQRKIVTLAVRYVEKTIHSMPNFYATRVTTRFHGVMEGLEDDSSGLGPGLSFRFKDISRATVLYRDGLEVVGDNAKKGSKVKESSSYGLADWGVFGPLLGAVISDTLRGSVFWDHWEKGAAGPLAVFSYEVPQPKSHFDVEYCCVSLERGMSSFGGMPGYFETTPKYHGEIAVDPANGDVLRLVVQTELDPNLPIVRDDIVVEYGPMAIGGQFYICPIRSVTISRAEASDGDRPQTYNSKEAIPHITLLNDVVFQEYHVFRAKVRVLNGDGTALQ